MHATIGTSNAAARVALKSGRTARHRVAVPLPGYLAAAVLLVMAIIGGLLVAGQGDPHRSNPGDLRYASQPVSPDASPERDYDVIDSCGVTFQQRNLDNPPMG